MTDIDPKDDPLDLLAALDQYRAAATELLPIREAVARAAGLWGVRQTESLTWAEVAAAAARVDNEGKEAWKRGEVPDRAPMLPGLMRAHQAAVVARERFANLAVRHSRVTLFIARRGETS